MGKERRIQRFGSIPYTNFKDKNRKINKLRTEIGRQVRISIESSFIVYEYWELQ